ncbi:VOC family protein [Roseateles cellulosilyticus]|uniref:Glyoxalase/bleomycin resistance/extradiol dioxygenase family protein n=1 Tax=Pelomonas cellulosilytica TaxID=2906762 RepID=A0ABS8XP33_9BURK|nr:glyoxalase/bleomycin resistance/extradiol dioxygenase family protein [Pelomonas sp. P8]MCE4554529.1 glyoxalase/bleomycin resistance/extradiol dioxygenase family protein [Pelomonas sp. P8]
MKIEPYLFFDGRCDEAIEFYQQALGARVEFLMRYAESPEPLPPGTLPPGAEDKVMHASLHIGGALVMVSDGMCSGAPAFNGFSLSLDCPDEDAAREAFAALADGGRVTMPLARTFWAPLFGMVNDRFGVGWMVGVSADAK